MQINGDKNVRNSSSKEGNSSKQNRRGLIKWVNMESEVPSWKLDATWFKMRCGAADGSPRENYIPRNIWKYQRQRRPRGSRIGDKTYPHLRLRRQFEDKSFGPRYGDTQTSPESQRINHFLRIRKPRLVCLSKHMASYLNPREYLWSRACMISNFQLKFVLRYWNGEIRGMFLDPAVGIHWGYFHLLKSRKFSVNLQRLDPFACGVCCRLLLGREKLSRSPSNTSISAPKKHNVQHGRRDPLT